MNDLTVRQCAEILKEEDKLAALCNLTALLKEALPDTNWVGFYFYKNGELVLGPFQGKVACTHLKLGKGVCGTAFENRQLLNVRNVHEFPGHIACDSASNSEIVVPLIHQNRAFGVLDIDSPSFDRFSLEDEERLLEVAKLVSERFTAQ